MSGFERLWMIGSGCELLGAVGSSWEQLTTTPLVWLLKWQWVVYQWLQVIRSGCKWLWKTVTGYEWLVLVVSGFEGLWMGISACEQLVLHGLEWLCMVWADCQWACQWLWVVVSGFTGKEGATQRHNQLFEKILSWQVFWNLALSAAENCTPKIFVCGAVKDHGATGTVSHWRSTIKPPWTHIVSIRSWRRPNLATYVVRMC